MNARFPQRPESHQLEEASHRFFVQHLPQNWTWEKPLHDYGVDLRVDIFEGNEARGLELLIQLKSSAQASDGDTESIELKTTTYNMLRGKLQVVMLVKYARADNEAYWLLLKDAREPGEGRDSVTIRIPKTKRISEINWQRIQEHVRDVTEGKLAANRG